MRTFRPTALKGLNRKSDRLFNPFRADLSGIRFPWVSPTVIDIEPLRGRVRI